MDYMQTLLILCPLVFLAGFVDAIAGGGGLIALPAYLFAGLPAHTAIGSNKLSSCSGLVAACYKYFKENPARLSVALYSALGWTVGAVFPRAHPAADRAHRRAHCGGFSCHPQGSGQR